MNDDEKILQDAGRDYAAGRYRQAADKFRDLLTRNPQVAELHINLGAALRAAGDTPDAEAAYRQATKIAPNSALAWFNLGNLMQDLRRPDVALSAYRKADALQPGTPEILNNLGVQLYESGAVADAVAQYDMALAARPDFADAHTNRGNALQRMGHMEDARAALQCALDAQPENPAYRLNMCAFLAANGRHDDALDWAERTLDADPGYVEARLKRASLLIQQGDFRTGFEEYEARWEVPNWHPMPKNLSMPVWRDEDISGKRLLIWNEQGFGDALMYARFLPQLRDMGAEVTFMVERPLARLMRQSLAGIDITALDAPPPAADYHLSIMSLPHRLGLRVDDLPGDAPYLRADPADVEAWRERVRAAAPDGRCIGVIWAGNPGQAHDYARSMDEDTARTLLDIDGVTFFNLLVGPRGNRLKHDRLVDLRGDIKDFADTAALMQALDLAVSVDSAPAHLAGALGCPVSILLAFDPDSRYLLGRSDCPWYPSATLLRQPRPGGWADAIAAARTGFAG